MKKFLLMVLCGFVLFQLAGCAGGAVRTETTTRERVDQEASGNRGFIFGKPASAPKEPTFTERKVYRVEVEMPKLQLPQWMQRKEKQPQAVKKAPAVRPPKEDKVIWGNRGYIFSGQKRRELEFKQRPRAFIPESPAAKIKKKISQIIKGEPKKEAQMRTYKVRKNDTLQKISRRFYGTTKKWLMLYKANRDKLKAPDEVYPGQVLIIPEAKEFKK